MNNNIKKCPFCGSIPEIHSDHKCFGHGDFANEFLDNTQAKSLIAPMNEIEFSDSAMWCVNFYYHLFTRSSFSCGRSYDYMSNNFYVPGAMQMWEA